MEMESVLKTPINQFFSKENAKIYSKSKKCHRCHGNKMATASRVTFGTMVIIHGDREVPIREPYTYGMCRAGSRKIPVFYDSLV